MKVRSLYYISLLLLCFLFTGCSEEPEVFTLSQGVFHLAKEDGSLRSDCTITLSEENHFHTCGDYLELEVGTECIGDYSIVDDRLILTVGGDDHLVRHYRFLILNDHAIRFLGDWSDQLILFKTELCDGDVLLLNGSEGIGKEDTAKESLFDRLREWAAMKKEDDPPEKEKIISEGFTFAGGMNVSRRHILKAYGSPELTSAGFDIYSCGDSYFSVEYTEGSEPRVADISPAVRMEMIVTEVIPTKTSGLTYRAVAEDKAEAHSALDEYIIPEKALFSDSLSLQAGDSVTVYCSPPIEWMDFLIPDIRFYYEIIKK